LIKPEFGYRKQFWGYSEIILRNCTHKMAWGREHQNPFSHVDSFLFCDLVASIFPFDSPQEKTARINYCLTLVDHTSWFEIPQRIYS
jgi:hypothetical protein